ncbi:hypothetical protein NE237_007760 [Protea cynaroides]|uniref:Uncharacterized protein n=1 Tax=Protea cynaroides TaxID=273540 RepID=A0A9Q0KQU6_9MAGN|nr:hypothetical protein NE237_007760 [Protea cynaroides]
MNTYPVFSYLVINEFCIKTKVLQHSWSARESTVSHIPGLGDNRPKILPGESAGSSNSSYGYKESDIGGTLLYCRPWSHQNHLGSPDWTQLSQSQDSSIWVSF